MPFSNLNNSWSNLAQYYNSVTSNGVFAGTISNPNVTKTQKPEYPKIQYSSFDDGLIRGGALNATLSSTRDAVRIGKFLTSGKGGLFIIKQVGLQFTNPLLETENSGVATPSTSGGGFLSNIANSVTSFINSKSPNQIYNLGINTLAQVPINALGGHIIRHGLLPVGGVGFLEGDSLTNVKGYNYEKIVTTNNKTQGANYYDGLASPDSNTKFNTNRLVSHLATINKDSTKPVTLQQYNGGASSVYGIGKTIINTTSVRTTITQANNNKLVFNGFDPLLSSDIAEAKQAKLEDNLQSQLNNSILTYNKDIAGYNIEKRVGTTGTFKKVDAINVIDIVDGGTFYTNTNSTGSLASKVLQRDDVDGIYGNDIIKFRLEFLNNDGTPGVDNTTILAFRAYIDDFNDGMNAKWNSYRYMGRGEEFYVYEGFTRDINVSFTLFAHSVAEMKPLYRKLNYLMSTFAPDYSPANKMRGNIGYLTVGEYLLRQPGVFTDIKLSGFLDTHWEIGIDGNDQYEVPKHIKVGLSFKPIHTFLPRKAKYTNGKPDYNTPFITPDSKRYTYFANKAQENKYLG